MKNLATLLSSALFLTALASFGERNEQFKNLDNSVINISVINIVNPTCNGGKNGQVTIEVSGGEAPYSYNWNTFPNQYENTAINLSKGVYFVDVTDAKGNRSFRSIHVENPYSSSLLSKSNQNFDEIDLTATMLGSGSTYSYSLNDTPIESYKMAELPVGVHKLVVSDNNQCKVVQYIQVFEINETGKSEQFNSTVEFISDNGNKINVSKLIPSNEVNTIRSTKIILSKVSK